MSIPVSEDDLRRLADLEPTATTATSRARLRMRRRQRRSRIVLAGGLAAMVIIGGIGVWRLGASSDSSTADLPTTVTSLPDPALIPPFLPADSCKQPPPSIAVFVRSDATPSESDAIRDYLTSIPGASAVTYIDQEEGFKEFKEANPPEMVAAIRPEDLLVSFRVVLEGSDAGSVAADIKTLPGVMEVVIDPCNPRTVDQTGG